MFLCRTLINSQDTVLRYEYFQAIKKRSNDKKQRFRATRNEVRAHSETIQSVPPTSSKELHNSQVRASGTKEP